ncbi:hypothetical protein SISNIDRAFT_231108 [Sistotremastrum niveocremeum HHB9708]|uniref:Uncharacterized protein n=1 Tax=Sistotremastrum niveocremeum HHB9708 TaxID=1314777 RepID=A0A164Q039_9AGAM|nr:hypothetical protein SISNIDRAFT_231108 [Sistotremastrum niveocremeum HHB9708]
MASTTKSGSSFMGSLSLPQFAGMMSRGPGSSSATSNTPASAQGSVGALNGARDEQQENRQRPPPPVPWKPPTTLLRLQSGQEVVISFEGTSQYTQGGLSACGLAAMNAARLVLEQRNRNGVDLIEMLSSRDFLQSVMAITSMWSDQDHLEIEDIRGLPLFQSSLRHVGESNAQTSFETFGRLLATLRENSRRSSNPPSPSAVVITKPPEIVAIIYIPMPQNVRLDGVFAVFDSHPRSAKGTKGASFILFPSLEGTCDYLARSLFYMDPDILTGDIGELMVAQLTQYSGNFFVALGDEAQIDGLLPDARSNYQANLELFRMRRELAELQSSNRSLVSERDRLKERAAQVEDLQAELRKHDLNLKEFEVANRRTNARLTTVQQENGLLNKERKELQTLLQDVAFQPPDAKSLSRARSPNSPRGPRPDRRIVNDNEDDVTERDLQIREAQEMIMQLLKEKTQLESRITWTNNIAKETQARLEAERDEARSQVGACSQAASIRSHTER